MDERYYPRAGESSILLPKEVDSAVRKALHNAVVATLDAIEGGFIGNALDYVLGSYEESRAVERRLRAARFKITGSHEPAAWASHKQPAGVQAENHEG